MYSQRRNFRMTSTRWLVCYVATSSVSLFKGDSHWKNYPYDTLYKSFINKWYLSFHTTRWSLSWNLLLRLLFWTAFFPPNFYYSYFILFSISVGKWEDSCLNARDLVQDFSCGLVYSVKFSHHVLFVVDLYFSTFI